MKTKWMDEDAGIKMWQLIYSWILCFLAGISIGISIVRIITG